MTGHVPGQWPEALRTSPTRELIRREHLREVEAAWQDETLVRVFAECAAHATPDEIRDAAARIAARVVRAAEEAIQQQADALPQ